ncbi:hypothetical protein, partial [Escherichia coli]|uniref:hypothetical protein n=1 Tax=Escherichia coli TaxID=562 RepID=UPI0028991943
MKFKISSYVISLTGLRSGKKYSATDGLAKNNELSIPRANAIGSISNPDIQKKAAIKAAPKKIPPNTLR